MIHTIEVGKGKTFIAGLHWQPLAGNGRNEMPGLLRGAGEETTKLANEMNFDLVVFRTADTLQVGFASSDEGASAGHYSIAAAISKTIEMEYDVKHFLCVTETPDGQWLYVAQRNGVILPDGDYVGSEDEVRSRVIASMSVGDWDLVFAPGHWGVSGSEERELEAFLPLKGDSIDFKKWWRLSPVRKSVIKPMVIGGGVCAVLLVAGFAYQQHAEKQRQAELFRLAQLAAQAQGQQLHIEPPPWEQQPRALAVWEGCQGALVSLKTLWPGNWSPSSATCTNGSFTIAWTRGEYGWIEHLREIYPNVHLSHNGESASMSLPYETGSLASDSEPAPSERQRVLAMHSAGQQFGFTVALRKAQVAPTLPGQTANAPQPTWQELTWEVKNSALPPSIVLKALDGPAFRVRALQLNYTAGLMSWSMEGVQYVQP